MTRFYASPRRKLKEERKNVQIMLETARAAAPRIHNITNYVTVNDCANILLACGASPIMADDLGEAEEITSLCGGLCINIGTLNQSTIPSMFAAGRRANALGHPVISILWGRGVGAAYADGAAVLEEVKIGRHRAYFRSRRSRVARARRAASMPTSADAGTEIHWTQREFTKKFAEKTGAGVAVTGAIDIVADHSRAYCIQNGHPMMGRVTGTGCQLSALTAAYVTANPEKTLEAAAAAVCAAGLCGELALARMSARDGNSSYRNYIIDAIYNLTGDDLESGAKYEVR